MNPSIFGTNPSHTINAIGLFPTCALYALQYRQFVNDQCSALTDPCHTYLANTLTWRFPHVTLPAHPYVCIFKPAPLKDKNSISKTHSVQLDLSL
jgi:hypothetical protein